MTGAQLAKELRINDCLVRMHCLNLRKKNIIQVCGYTKNKNGKKIANIYGLKGEQDIDKVAEVEEKDNFAEISKMWDQATQHVVNYRKNKYGRS